MCKTIKNEWIFMQSMADSIRRLTMMLFSKIKLKIKIVLFEANKNDKKQLMS